MHNPAIISSFLCPAWILWTKSLSAKTVHLAAILVGFLDDRAIFPISSISISNLLAWLVKKEDIIAGLCKAVVGNYLNNIGKGKKILPPIVFQGGVSKNIGVVEAFKEELDEDVYVDENGHLMGALGVALLSRNCEEIDFDFKIADIKFTTGSIECKGCPNNCEIIVVKKENKIIDSWGNRCEKGSIVH